MQTTLPLYDPAPPHPDAWHRVAAPGGYESWYFDAEDDAADLRLVVIFSHGFPFDTEYLRRYRAFLRNPTRLSPPTPAGFPSAHFLVWEQGRLLARFAYRYPPDAFEASGEVPDVRVGPHRMLLGVGGTFAVTVAAVAMPGPRGNMDVPSRVAADLWFTPRPSTPPLERPLLSREWSGADHRWVIASPLCVVGGTIRLTGGRGGDREIRVAGRGYHDHRYGSGPLFLKPTRRWMWGRILGGDRAETFHLAVPRDSTRPAEYCLVEADASGVREVSAAPPPAITAARGAPFGLTYPGVIDLGNGRVLREPTLVEANPFTLRLAYRAPRIGPRGTAFCELTNTGYLKRSRTPGMLGGAVVEAGR